MSKLIDNIERRMRVKHVTQKALALQAGLNETAVRDILKGRSRDPQFSTLIGIARVLGCTVENLFGDPADVGDDAGSRLEDGIASGLFVDELDILTAPAPASVTDGRRQRVISTWRLPADALDSMPGGSIDLKIVRVQGDSMAPDFMPGDRVMVNVAEKNPSPPGVFLLWDGVGFILRRCELVAGANPPRLVLRPSNADYGLNEVALKDIVITGRVVGRWEKI